MAIAVVIALAAVTYISVHKEWTQPAASRMPPESVAPIARSASPQPAKIPKPESASPEKSLENERTQDYPEFLISSLKSSIAEGDWEKSKVICEKLAALPSAFDQLARILLDNSSARESDIALRWRAAYILGLMGEEKAIGIFEQSLISEKAKEVRSNIVLALGMLKNPDTRPVLESVLLNSEEEPEIRRSAAQYLARIPDSSGAASLVNLLYSDSPEDLKIWAIEALPESADKKHSSATLADILLSSEDTEMKQSAAKSLGRIADPDTITALTTSLRTDPDFRVRNTCAEALGNFTASDDAVQTLRVALVTDDDPTVRGSAAEALGTLHSKEAIGDFRDALKKEPDRVVRVRIVEALGKIGGEECIKILKDAAENDPAVHIRNAAQQALESIKE